MQRMRSSRTSHISLFGAAVVALTFVLAVSEAQASDLDTFSLAEEHPADSMAGNLDARLRSLSQIELDEVTWLARCIYSESDRPHEQELVAWVVRNRVETQYRGTTYREVVLEYKQFSAFNSPSRRRDHILSLNPNTPSRPWQRALGIALRVYQSAPTQRPFAQTVRHFYSPVSMKGRSEPHWAGLGEPLSSARLGVDPHRFRFFSNVDEGIVADKDAEQPELAESGPSGFRLPKLKPSGKISRPRRPRVRPARRDR